MRFRLNLQWTVVLLVAGGMTGTLLLSAHLHGLITGSLVEEDRYNAAVGQVVDLAERIVSLERIDQPDRVQRDILLMTGKGRDFTQIDVFRTADEHAQLIATNDLKAPRLPALDASTQDNDLGEMERPLPDVVTIEVQRSDGRYWMISAGMKDHGATGYVTALVRKNSYNAMVSRLQYQHNLVLAAAIAVSVLLLYVLFAEFFRVPARGIAAAMARARGGDLSSRAEVLRHDELGEIARRFNGMMEDLSARDTERETLLKTIRRFNVELHEEVNSATRQLRAANEALFESQQRLARSETLAVLGQVAGSLAHEIGTPLNSISGHVHLLTGRLSHDADATRRLGIIGRQLDFIVGIVRALLQRARQPWAPLRLTDLNELISEVVWLVTPTLDAHAIDVTSTLGPLAPVLADRDRLHQVFLNLINNSVDAMPGGGRLEIVTRIDSESRAAEVTVRDTGPGIPPDRIDSVFEPLWTTKESGGGFGLAIAREIMIQHGGAIGIERNTAGGAIFWLRLPLADAAEAAS